MIVLDSSVVIEWLLGLPYSEAVADRLASADSLHAPALLDIEVIQVVRRYAAAGEISPQAGSRVVHTLGELDITRYMHGLLLPTIWNLRHNLTAYDAAFVALAAILDAPLVTRDIRIARASLPQLFDKGIVIDVIGR